MASSVNDTNVTSVIRVPFGSAEWKKLRESHLYSSEISAVLNINDEYTSMQLFRNKLKGDIPLNDYENMEWEDKYHYIATKHFAKMFNTSLTRLGIVYHPNMEFLAGEPYALTPEKILLNISLPIRREIKKGKTPYADWIKMQVDMEVCNLESCYYFQCQFKEYTNIPKELLHLPHGKQRKDGPSWVLIDTCIDIVKRDKEWFNNARTDILIFWQKIEDARNPRYYTIHSNPSDILIDVRTQKISFLTQNVFSGLMERVQQNIATPVVPAHIISGLDATVSRFKKRRIETEAPERAVSPVLVASRNVVRASPPVDAEQSTYQIPILPEREDNLAIHPYIVQLQPDRKVAESKVADSYINASDIKNFMLNDTLLDWLNMYGDMTKADSSECIGLMHKENEDFVNKIYEACEKNHTLTCVKIVPTDAQIFQHTLDEMFRGTHIIQSAALRNEQQKTCANVDFLIRSDVLNKLFTNTAINPELMESSSKFSVAWHYVVVLVQNSTLRIRFDGAHLLDSGYNLAIKGYACLCNDLLSDLQGYIPTYAYVIGSRWIYTSQGKEYSCNTWNNRAGVIDFGSRDAHIKEKVSTAIAWRKELTAKGSKWTIDPPSDARLYPNMQNEYDIPWTTFKRVLAEKNAEITDLMFCTPVHRANAFKENVYSWRDKKCTAKLLGINGIKQGPLLDAILNINRTKSHMYQPEFIDLSIYKPKIEFFIAIASIQKSSLSDNISKYRSTKIEDITYLMSLGYTVNDASQKQGFFNFQADYLSLESEKNIVENFYDTLICIIAENNAVASDCTLYCWHEATKNKYLALMFKYFDKFSSDIQWQPLYPIFYNEQILINGSLNFSLESIALALYSHKLISTKYEKVTFNYLDLTRLVSQAYQTNDDMLSIKFVAAGATECDLVREILEFIRNNLIFTDEEESVTVKLVGKRRKEAIEAGEPVVQVIDADEQKALRVSPRLHQPAVPLESEGKKPAKKSKVVNSPRTQTIPQVLSKKKRVIPESAAETEDIPPKKKPETTTDIFTAGH
jgi:hypothetical protein